MPQVPEGAIRAQEGSRVITRESPHLRDAGRCPEGHLYCTLDERPSDDKENCWCRECHSQDFNLDDKPRHEGHIAARWGDIGYRAYLDGGEVSNQCFEACAGEDGFVILAAHKIRKHICSCAVGVCERKVFGDVRVERIMEHSFWRRA